MSIAPVSQLFSAVWGITLGDERIRIAVLDGPVDRTHSAFQGARLGAIDTSLSPPGASQGVASEHGTHVASLIFGQHESPIKGIAARCSGLLIPIFGNSPDGSARRCSQVDLALAIAAAVDRRAHIINISGGEFSSSGRAHPILGDVLDRCDRQGVLIVAAAGNDGCDCLHVPAAHPSILAVGAATAAGEPLGSSNWGARYQTHGILAIGENLRGAAPGGKIVERSGTSFATAIVSGVAGLLMSLEVSRGIPPNGPRMRQLLLDSSDPCPHLHPSNCLRYLSGVLNIDQAISLLSKKGIKMSFNEPNGEFRSSTEPSGNYPNSYSQSWRPLGQSPLSAADEPRANSPPSPPMAGIRTSGCACGGGAPPRPQFVFAFGEIGVLYPNRARFDSIQQHMRVPKGQQSANPLDPKQLVRYLKKKRWETSSVIWTLNFDSTPVYAISVDGPDSQYVGKLLRQFLRQHHRSKIERVSVPGVLAGRISLPTGMQLPLIEPEPRGMYSWTTDALVSAVAGQKPAGGKKRKRFREKKKGLRKFLNRVYIELRNRGQAPGERAINYAATNPYEIGQIFKEAAKRKIELHSIDATPTPFPEAGTDCWDVTLRFFYPRHKHPTSKRAFRFRVDVSDVVPVTVGRADEWLTAD